MSPDAARVPVEGNSRRPRRSTEEVRRLLIEAGRDDFRDRGFTGASVRDIAGHADVKESVLFRHFGTKAALFERAVLDPLVEFLDGYSEQWSSPETAGAEVEVLVEDYLGGLYDVALRNRKLILALMSAHAFEPELFGEINQEPGLRTILDKITDLTVMHQEAHDLTLPDPPITTRISFAMALGMALLDEWLFPQDDERPDSERITAELTAFQLHGVTHRPGTPVDDAAGSDSD